MSRHAFMVVALLATAGFALGQSYPHAFPRKGAVKLFENDRVMVWDATWPIGVDQPIHQHKYDMAVVFLRYGKIKVTSLDGKATIAAPFEAPRVVYQAKGVTHKEEAVGSPGDPERRGIMVDLKDSAPPQFALKPGQELAFPREGATDVVDNARVRIWDYSWLPNRPVAGHVHDKDSVEVFVASGTLVTKLAGGQEMSKTVAYGDTRFVPRGQVDREEAVSGTPRAFIIELK
jgi:quercetin dioxygenase-like cupin family protein